MTLIAVSQRVDVHPARNERRDALDQNWARFLSACGFVMVALPNNERQVQLLLEQLPLDGVLLTGGNDLGHCPERDTAECAMIDWARRTDKPLMGVCRGMQMILSEDGASLERIEGHAGTRHNLDGQPERAVNSYHQFGFRAVPDVYEILARADDGVIEQVRHKQARVLAMMWHPERETPFDARDIALFQGFFR